MKHLKYNDYKNLAGAEWPSYTEYVNGNIDSKLVKEIREYEQKFGIEKLTPQSLNEKYYSLNFNFATNYFFSSFLLAILSIYFFIYFGGTIEKFFLMFFLFRLKKEAWTSVVHRWLCHHQFDPKKWARYLFLFVLVIGSRTPPVKWIQTHWAHHKDQDTDLDPYPPSWGLLNLLIVGSKYHKTYPLGRWLIASDIKFVLRNIIWLRWCYWTVIAILDIQIFIISFFFMNFYEKLATGLESYMYHDGFKTQKPIDNYPLIGYPILFFFGTNWMHKSHSEKPWVFNCSTINPNMIDFEYQYLKIFAKK